jgi:hypothetical protein
MSGRFLYPFQAVIFTWNLEILQPFILTSGFWLLASSMKGTTNACQGNP